MKYPNSEAKRPLSEDEYDALMAKIWRIHEERAAALGYDLRKNPTYSNWDFYVKQNKDVLFGRAVAPPIHWPSPEEEDDPIMAELRRVREQLSLELWDRRQKNSKLAL